MAGPDELHVSDTGGDWTPGQFIPLHYHFNMLTDRDRMDAFRRAIDYVVSPGARVLELGGGTGVLSFMAAKKAQKVWCVEKIGNLADAARRFLARNPNGDRVEVVRADAAEYLPPEPVDVVICEMLHSALLRERQLHVIESFKDRYYRQFGVPGPKFIPEATLLAVEPIEQDFRFGGYLAPIPVFQQPSADTAGTTALGEAAVVVGVVYDEPFSTRIRWQGRIQMARDGHFNAIRIITKSVLAFQLDRPPGVEWFSQHLVLPIEEPVRVRHGEVIEIGLDYDAGADLDALPDSLKIRRCGDRHADGTRRGAA